MLWAIKTHKPIKIRLMKIKVELIFVVPAPCELNDFFSQKNTKIFKIYNPLSKELLEEEFD